LDPELMEEQLACKTFEKKNLVGMSNRESSCKVEIAKTPKVLEVPRAGSRGKRSSRAKMKAMPQHKWQYSHVLKGSSSESHEAETDSSGRPCRRTAGRDSGFYLLLMHSC
jgi:hypothetical protein